MGKNKLDLFDKENLIEKLEEELKTCKSFSRPRPRYKRQDYSKMTVSELIAELRKVRRAIIVCRYEHDPDYFSYHPASRFSTDGELLN